MLRKCKTVTKMLYPGLEISDSEAEKILTVGDAIKFIESKSAQ